MVGQLVYCVLDLATFEINHVFGSLGFWTLAPLRYAAKFDPFLSLDCARVEGVGAPSGNHLSTHLSYLQLLAVSDLCVVCGCALLYGLPLPSFPDVWSLYYEKRIFPIILPYLLPTVQV